MAANDRQVAGNHYQRSGQPQHWDLCGMFELDYFQGQITKYVFRWKLKKGIEDLRKAQHFLEKYIEVVERGYGGDEMQAAIAMMAAMDAPVQHHTTPFFSMEGFKEGKVMYRCRNEECKEHFEIPASGTPDEYHRQCRNTDRLHELDDRIRRAGLGHLADDPAVAHVGVMELGTGDELEMASDSALSAVVHGMSNAERLGLLEQEAGDATAAYVAQGEPRMVPRAAGDRRMDEDRAIAHCDRRMGQRRT